jgi:heptosyltransferase-3
MSLADLPFRPTKQARPTLPWLVWKIMKASIRHPMSIPHIAAAVSGAARTHTRLRTHEQPGRPGTAIAMIEHMGDIIAAEPVARYAARQDRGTPVTWICRRPYREVVESFTAVDSIIIVNCMAEWLLLWATEPTGRESGVNWGRVWDLHLSGRSCPVCGIGFRKPGAPGRVTHDTYYHLGNLLKANCLLANIPILDEPPELSPSAAIKEEVDRLRLPERFVAIHCKSSEARRDWQAHKWRALVTWITDEAGLTVCEVGGSPVVATRDTSRTRNLCGALAVMKTAEVIGRAALFIGIDSGPAHLANASGTPGVILLGRYHGFKTYTPYSGGYGDGSRAELIQWDGPVSDIPVEAVVAAASRQLRPPAASPAAAGQTIAGQ